MNQQIPENMKQCAWCKEIKLLDDFSPEKRMKKGRKSYCKKCIAEKRREYYSRNKEKQCEYARKYTRENRDDILRKKREYHQKEEVKEMARIRSERRRERVKQAADGTIPLQFTKSYKEKKLKDLLIAQDNKCYICGNELDDTKTIDHWIPIAKGGKHSVENIVWVCIDCNRKKHDKMPDTLPLI